MFGIFGDLFDMNNDGELDTMERAMELGIIIGALDECQKERIAEKLGVEVSELDDMDELAERLDFDIDDLEDIIQRAEEQGIDIDDLEDMDDLEDFDEDEGDE